MTAGRAAAAASLPAGPLTLHGYHGNKEEPATKPPRGRGCSERNTCSRLDAWARTFISRKLRGVTPRRVLRDTDVL